MAEKNDPGRRERTTEELEREQLRHWLLLKFGTHTLSIDRSPPEHIVKTDGIVGLVTY